jgi:hypothetical protein
MRPWASPWAHAAGGSGTGRLAPVNRPAPRTAPEAPATPSTRRPRRSFAVVASAFALVAVAGCSSQSPLQTLVPYQPADGVAASSGPSEARDLLIVAAAKGDPGYLSGSLINTGIDTIQVAFASQEAAASNQSAGKVQLKPREQLRIETITIPNVAVAPGALTNIVMTTPTGQVMVAVPVLAPTEGSPYASLTPTDTPTPSSSTTLPVGTKTTAG